MADLAMRPLSLGEILDRSFAILRSRFGAMFVVGVICFIIPLVMMVSSLADFASVMQFQPGIKATDPQFDAALRVMGHFFWIALVGFACFVVARGAWVYEAAEMIQGRRGGVAAALRVALRFAPAMAGLALLEGVIFFGVYLVIAIPAAIIIGVTFKAGGAVAVLSVAAIVIGGVWALFWVYAGLYISAPALLLDSPAGGVFRALERAWALSKGRRGIIVGIVLLIGVFAFIVQFAMTMALGLSGRLAGAGAESVGPTLMLAYGGVLLVQIAIGLLGYIIQTVMYYDLRVRREGLDLEVMAQSLPRA